MTSAKDPAWWHKRPSEMTDEERLLSATYGESMSTLTTVLARLVLDLRNRVKELEDR